MSGGAALASPMLAVARPQVARARPLTARRARLAPTDRRQLPARSRDAPTLHTQLCACSLWAHSHAHHFAHRLAARMHAAAGAAVQQRQQQRQRRQQRQQQQRQPGHQQQQQHTSQQHITTSQHNPQHADAPSTISTACFAAQPASSISSARTASPARSARSAQTWCSLACQINQHHIMCSACCACACLDPPRRKSPYSSGLYKPRSEPLPLRAIQNEIGEEGSGLSLVPNFPTLARALQTPPTHATTSNPIPQYLKIS